MTVLAADPSALFADALFCAGLGLWLALFCHIMELIMEGAGRAWQYAAHIGYALLSAFVVFTFIIGKSYSGEPRWFMLLGLAVGAVVYALAIAPATETVAYAFRGLARNALAAVYVIYSKTLGRLFSLASRTASKTVGKIAARLQRAGEKAYNLLRKKRKTDQKDLGNEETRKKARKPVGRT